MTVGEGPDGARVGLPDVGTGGAAEPARVLRLVMRIGVELLGSGAQADDVEAAIDDVARAYGVESVQAAVTFAMITVSRDPGSGQPITLLHFVRERTVDFDRLAAVSSIVRQARRGELDLDAAEAALGEVEHRGRSYGRGVAFLAPAVSAAGSTLVFGGDGVDALVTLLVALLIQPALTALGRSELPVFFRVSFGAMASTILVAVLVALGAPIAGGIVLTGSLLRFLPGYALVSGFRDLVGQSIVSGTARLAEALLLGAAVAGGAALAIRVAAAFGVQLAIAVVGPADWTPAVMALAAVAAVGGFAVQLGVPRRAMAFAAVLGATAWLLYDVATRADGTDVALATLAAAFLVGALGRLLARWQQAPAALFVVPAILPLLPGLLVVQAMLATVDAVRVAGLIDATATAFLVGVGVASGDIAVVVVRRIRERIVAPAVDAVAGGVDILVVRPVGRALGGADTAGGTGVDASRGRSRRRRMITPRAQETGGHDVGSG